MSNDPPLPHLIPEYDTESGTLEPLPVLQAFLSQRNPCNSYNETEVTAPDDLTTSRLDELFRVGAFLCGTTALEGALSILDASGTQITHVVSAPSQRSAYLVTPSSSSSDNPTTKYLCLLPTSPPSDSSAIYYCTCRSFLEKNSKSRHVQPCKHLLSLMLLPHVGVKCNTVETLTDEEFGRLLVRSTLSLT